MITPAARVAYFEALLAGPDLTGNWRRLWQGQVDYWREVGNGDNRGGGRDVSDAAAGAGAVGDVGGRDEPEWRAANERAWANLLTALGEPWLYEALERDLSRALRYMPDFWLPERLTWLEIKSNPPTPGELRVARQLREATGRRVYVLSGWPGRGRFAATIIDAAGEAQTTRPDWAALALCQLFDVKFSELYAAMEAIRK